MSSPCQSCLGSDCIGGYALDDVDLYSLQGDPFLFVIDCPDGYDCNGFRNFGQVSLQCCDELLTQAYEVPISQDDYNKIVAGLVAQCAARAPFCGQPIVPPPGPGSTKILYYNRTQTCTVRCPVDGLPFTYTIPPGTFIGFTQADADAAAHRGACTEANRHRICLSRLPTLWCANVAFNRTITASGASLAISPQVNFWDLVSGTLPTGLTFNGGYTPNPYATIIGTPTAGGLFTFSIGCTDPHGDRMVKPYTICMVDVLPNPSGSDDFTMPDATIHQPYNNALTVTSCAPGPLSYAIVSGALPVGLTLDPTSGIISGTPIATTPLGYIFTVRVTGNGFACEKQFTMVTVAAVTVTVTAYYTLDSAQAITGDLIDSVAGLHMFKQPGSVSPNIPALISNGLERQDALNTAYTTGQVAALAYPDTGGWSMFGWFKINSEGPANVGSELVMSVGNGSIFIDVGSTSNPGNVEISWTDANFQSVQTYVVATTGAWHFFHLFYDPVSQQVGFSFDNTAATMTGAAVSFTPNATNVWDFFGPLVSTGVSVTWDEIGLKFDRKLTSAEQTYLYNSGSGRTYPF